MYNNLSIIVAASRNLVIGKNNDMPWYLPTDIKHFKDITKGKPVIMGRKCWESLPERFRPLPNRTNYVLTSDPDASHFKGAYTTDSLDSILLLWPEEPEIFAIGGSGVYKEAFQHANKLFFTHLLEEVDGDVYLEGFNPEEWEVVSESEIMEENGLKFYFAEYKRK